MRASAVSTAARQLIRPPAVDRRAAAENTECVYVAGEDR